MTLGFAVARWCAAIAAAGAVAWTSRCPLPIGSADAAVLRLAWSARPERIEHCQGGADPIASVPAAVRAGRVCDDVPAHYRLRVSGRGRVLLERQLSGGGLRCYRRMYVFHEFELPPGESRVEVSLTRLESGAANTAKHRVFADVAPPRLEFDETLRLEAGRAVLVTFDPETRALVARTAP